MYELIGCPMHFGVSDEGLTKGIDILNEKFPDLFIKKISEEPHAEQGLKNLISLNSVAATCQAIAREVDRIAATGNRPLFIGGDHSAAIGSISGMAVHCRDMGLLWIDSHSDIHTDTSTISGNIHGMPVSAVLGQGAAALTGVYGKQPKLHPSRVVLLGLRDVDPPEWDIIKSLGVKTISYKEIMERGIRDTLLDVSKYLKGIDGLHVSFDLDSMDPAIIKGVTVPVKDGFTREDVGEMFDILLKDPLLRSLDIVEFNPAYDTDGETALFVSHLIRKVQRNY